MNTFETTTGHGNTVVQVTYTTKDDLVDKIKVYKAGFEVTDLLSYNQILEIESEAAMHFFSEGV
jgi:hypothetical protein